LGHGCMTAFYCLLLSWVRRGLPRKV
jgi:hypothetical protein